MLSSLLAHSARAAIVLMTVVVVALGAPCPPPTPHRPKPAGPPRRAPASAPRRTLPSGGCSGSSNAAATTSARPASTAASARSPRPRSAACSRATASLADGDRRPEDAAPAEPPRSERGDASPPTARHRSRRRPTPPRRHGTTPPPPQTTAPRRPRRPRSHPRAARAPRREARGDRHDDPDRPRRPCGAAGRGGARRRAAPPTPAAAQRALLAAIDRDLYLEGHERPPRHRRVPRLRARDRGPARRRRRPAPRALPRRRPAQARPGLGRGRRVRRSPSQLAAGEPVIGYVTADPDPPAEQEAFMAIEAACDQAGWQLDEIVRDSDTGRMVGRPGLTRALERIAAGEARGLVVSDARRLVRSLADLGALLEWFRDAEAALVAARPRSRHGDDPRPPDREHAHLGLRLGGRPRRRRARGAASRACRPRTARRSATADDRAALVERIGAMRAAGMSLEAIADQLEQRGRAAAARRGPLEPAAVARRALDRPPAARSLRDELPAIPTHNRQG